MIPILRTFIESFHSLKRKFFKMFIDFRERGRVGKRERKRERERETLI